MKLGITGASGLLGGNLAVALAQAGHEVVAAKRGRSKVEHLSAFPIRWVDAELTDADSLARAFSGCEGLFHCAAAVSIRMKLEPWIVQANVEGTRAVINAVRRAGMRRLVHCSTVGAVGLSTDGRPCDETARWNMADFGVDDAYVTTKRQAQDLVLAAAAAGLDAVVVNPTYMIGPLDAKPSSGRLVRELVLGRVPGYTRGRNNFVDVRDAARGMLAAFEKGRKGELYILGGENMTYKEFFDLVSDAVGAPRVRREIPAWAAALGGHLGDAALALGIDSPLTTATARWGSIEGFVFSSDKARRELGYKTSDLRKAVEDCAAWLRENGLLPAGR